MDEQISTPTAPTQPPPAADPGQSVPSIREMVQLLSVLFVPSDLVEVRTFHKDRGNDTRQFWLPAREIPTLFRKLSALNLDGEHNIYFGANPRIREGGKGEDVALARSLVADWDEVGPEEIDRILADAKLPAPTLVVYSGHGLHAYWVLTTPLTDLLLWAAAQAALIARAKSDDKIKDPPRVMRLPGFLNLADPRKDETNEPCRILRINAEARYELSQVVGEIAPPVTRPPAAAPSNEQDRVARLSKSTLQFCFAGAPEGERNQRLFSAACDMAGVGISCEEARSKLSLPAGASGLSPAEIEATILSAYDKPRSPAVPDEPAPSDDAPIASAFQRNSIPAPATETPAADAPPAQAAAPAPSGLLQPPAVAPGERLSIANVVDASTSEGEPVRYYIPLPQIASNVSEAMGGWPRRAGGILFAVNDSSEEIPGLHSVRWIANHDQLFAWIGHRCNVRWTQNEAKHQLKKSALNPPTKREAFEYIKEAPLQNYRAVEVLPHYPPIDDLFYVPCRLPPVPIPDGDYSTPLFELVSRFNPETEEDRQLMLAALLTPGWGGPAGARPAFVFCSEFGRGVGKTATATILAEIWGGAIGIGAKEDWDKVRGRLLGGESLTRRIAVVDNVKGKFHGADIEGAITAPVIDGWKPYFGQASRPNLLTWFFTANSPSLSRDLADRSIIIKLGAQRHGTDFIRWAGEHIRANRALILAELFEILRGEALCTIRAESRDRWGAWQDAILTRFDNGNELAAAAIARRPAVDSDLDDAEEIAQAVQELVDASFSDTSHRVIRISRKQLAAKLIDSGIVDRNTHPKAITTIVKDKLNTGSLTFLSYGQKKVDGVPDRFWFYRGSASADAEVDVLPDFGAQQNFGRVS